MEFRSARGTRCTCQCQSNLLPPYVRPQSFENLVVSNGPPLLGPWGGWKVGDEKPLLHLTLGNDREKKRRQCPLGVGGGGVGQGWGAISTSEHALRMTLQVEGSQKSLFLTIPPGGSLPPPGRPVSRLAPSGQSLPTPPP